MVCFKRKRVRRNCPQKGWLGINKDTYSRTVNAGNYKWKYDVEYIGQKLHGNSIIASIALHAAPLSGHGTMPTADSVGCLGIGNSSANTRSWWN